MSPKPTNQRLTTIFLLILFPVSIAPGQSRFRGQKEFLPYTRNLPAIDKIEVFKLKLNDHDEWTGEFLDSRTLSGATARKLASLWRRQTYNDHQSACHNPGYAIKFYAHGKLFAHANVCFSCNNMSMITPHLEKLQNFGPNPLSEQLEGMFSDAFNPGKT
jgi:hypothetical protein